MKLLERFIEEEESRRKYFVNELKLLSEYFQKSIKSEDFDKILLKILQKLQDLRDNEQQIIENINQKSKNLMPIEWQIITNKNFEILRYACDVIDKNQAKIWHEKGVLYNINCDKIPNFDDKNDKMANSYLSAAVIFMLCALSVLHDAKIAEIIENYLAKINILQPQTSAIIETCSSKRSEINDIATKSEFFSAKLTAMYSGFKGYFFGGHEVKYNKKQYRFKDCSSAIAEFLGINCEISTFQMEDFFHKKIVDSDAKLFAIFKQKLSRSAFEDCEIGDIIMWVTYNVEKRFAGHIGVISKISGKNIELISYARNVPYMEGLGVMIVDINAPTARKYYFFKAR